MTKPIMFALPAFILVLLVQIALPLIVLPAILQLIEYSIFQQELVIVNLDMLTWAVKFVNHVLLLA